MSIKHDDLFARARERDYEKPCFDAENNNVTPPNSPETAVSVDLSNEKTWNTPRTRRERFPKIFPQTEELCDVADTYY